MDIAEISIENFMAIGKIEANLSNKGLVLVQGENEDDSSQDSNGSGKSSFPDAISWCLFGVTARGETGDKVINRNAKNNCRVTVKLIDGDDGYLISRHRKYTKLKNSLKVEHIDLKTNDVVDVTGGTDKITQEMVHKALGCSEEVFNAAIYSGQDSMADLPGMTDKQLKQLIEEAAGTELLQAAHAIAKERLRDAKMSLADSSRTVDMNQALVNQREANIVDVLSRRQQWEDKSKDRLRDAINTAKELRAAEVDIKAKIDLTDLKSLLDQQKAAKKSIDAVAGEHEEERKLSKELSRQESSMSVLDSKVKQGKVEAIDRKKSLDLVEDSVGEPCGSCGKPHTVDDLNEIRDRRKVILNKSLVSTKKLMVEQKALTESLSKQRSLLSMRRVSMTDITEAVALESQLAVAIRVVEDMVEDAQDINTELLKQVSHAKSIKTEENPFDDQLENANELLKETLSDLKAAKKEVKVWEQGVMNSEEAARVYGPAGVRAHILDTVTPFLNNRSAHYLSHLTDGNISALWSTLTATAKGELREKFSIEVKSITGAETFKGLSGGEKRKVRLACSMALQDLVASRASKPISLYIADEIDHALDESGLERLMAILDEKAKERGTVLTISHNSLSDWIRSSVTIKKEGGYASLNGAALS